MRTYRHFAGEVVEVEEELDVERIPKALLDEQFLQISVEQPVDVASRRVASRASVVSCRGCGEEISEDWKAAVAVR